MKFDLPKGYRFSGVSCGLKPSGAKDMTLIVSETPAVAAGVYTRNQVVAAPVVLCREHTPTASARAVVVNSGNANACTGHQGMSDAQRMCQLVAELGDFTPEQVLVMSTGVIGRLLDMACVESGTRSAYQNLNDAQVAFQAAADGILTTDKGRKVASRSLTLNGHEICLAGMAKGAGMIGPNMATMLCCVLTDAKLETAQAQGLLKQAVDLSFNNISVEGHTSTNDTMLLLANGQSGGPTLASKEEALFAEALNDLCIELAKQIPADGEGAKHLVEIQVRGAESDQDARTVAESVASSNLVKTAIYGNDPNWGRIVSAAGYAGPPIKMELVQLRLNGFNLFDRGEPIPFDESAVSASLREQATAVIELLVGDGTGTCTHWTSDLTVEYVRFNSEYTT